MDINPHMQEVIDRVGLRNLAEHLGVKYQAVQRYPYSVPSERVLQICRADEWRVRPHQLRPDLYPHPHDGLPEHLREAA